MTYLILTLAVLYAASLGFVVILLTSTLWRERTAPLDTPGTALSLAAAPDTSTAGHERHAPAEAHHAAKTA